MCERCVRDSSRRPAPRAPRPQVTRHTGHTHQVTRSTLVCVTRPTAHAGARLTRAQLTRGRAPPLTRAQLTRGHGSRWARGHGSPGHAGLGSRGLGSRGHGVTGLGSRVRVREGGEGLGRTSPRFTCCFTCEARVSKVKQGAVLSLPSGTRGCSLRVRVWRARLWLVSLCRVRVWRARVCLRTGSLGGRPRRGLCGVRLVGSCVLWAC